MTRFSAAFSLSNSQADLDFVDIDLSTDMPLYLDPYAIGIRHDEWSERCGDAIRAFFSNLLDVLRAGDTTGAASLLNNLHEPNETHLGVSQGTPSGRGVGRHKAAQLAAAFVNSRAFRTGVLTDMAEAELFVHGVGRDTISDLTTNVIRGLLAEYTGTQCALHGVPQQPVGSIGPVWNVAERRWESRSLMLPVYHRKPILLVPKFSVRHRLSIDSQEFYNFHMIEFLRQEYLESGSGLVHVFKSRRRKGERTVYKNSVKELHPFIKDDLANFVRDHPEVLEVYKSMVGSKGPLTNEELQVTFNERLFAAALRRQIAQIPHGNAAASQYHNFALGVCTFLFYPGLICPIKEHEIHEGRKRIDIKYTNAGEDGFFQRMQQLPQTRSSSVMIECKNYTKEVANPELDQLSGRFGHQRGFFGMLLCRQMEDRGRIINRCRDAVNDQRGYMLVLEDADLDTMLGMVEQGARSEVDRFLHRRFDEIAP